MSLPYENATLPRDPIAWLWQHSETGRQKVVMPDTVLTADASWHVVGPLYLEAALAQPPSAEVQGLDSVRFEWWFSKEPKYEFFDQYMEGVSAGWSLDQWRTAIDAAMAAALKDTP